MRKLPLHFVSKRKVWQIIGRGALKDLLLVRPLALKSQLQKTLLLLATRGNTAVFAALQVNGIFPRRGKPGLGSCVGLGMLGWGALVTAPHSTL